MAARSWCSAPGLWSSAGSIRRRTTPWALLLDTTTWVSKLAGLLAEVVPGMAPYKPHLATIGFGCEVAGTVYKGRAKLGTSEEQQLIDGVQTAIVAKLAPSPSVLALTLANVSQAAPPTGIVRLGARVT
jgi:hypothetical protein